MRCEKCGADVLVLWENNTCARCHSEPAPTKKAPAPKPPKEKKSQWQKKDAAAEIKPPEPAVDHQAVAREHIAKRAAKRRQHLGRIEVLTMIEKKLCVLRGQTEDEGERRAYTKSIAVVQDHHVIYRD